MKESSTTLLEEDLKLINNLSSRKYAGYSIMSNSTPSEKEYFDDVKRKLRNISRSFSNKYASFGPFIDNVSPESNPITQGNTLSVVWSTFFKGTHNKQYSAQISFVIDRHKPLLHIGFYFGSASSRSLNNENKAQLESTLTQLGANLANHLDNNQIIRDQYNDLFDLGFLPCVGENTILLPDEWVSRVGTNNKAAHISAKVYPNESRIIDIPLLDTYISQVIFLMNLVDDSTKYDSDTTKIIPPLTPEQWAKLAERRSQIGYKGELFILQKEKERLIQNGMLKEGYPRHVALESSHYGYDILSLDSRGNDLFIEVKSTTRPKKDPNARKFFLSKNEYEIYLSNKDNYKLYRVYDIEGQPEYDIFNLDNLDITPNGYEVGY